MAEALAVAMWVAEQVLKYCPTLGLEVAVPMGRSTAWSVLAAPDLGSLLQVNHAWLDQSAPFRSLPLPLGLPRFLPP